MSVDLQSVLDRLEHVERQARGWKLLVVVALLIAAASIALPILRPTMAASPASDRARFSVVEANRFVLRDNNGKAAGGMEVRPDGTIRVVLGSGFGTMGAAFLEVQRDGIVHLTLRGPDGSVRASLAATQAPTLALSANGLMTGATLIAASDGSGALVLKDRVGRIRYKAP